VELNRVDGCLALSRAFGIHKIKTALNLLTELTNDNNMCPQEITV
jgi:hypothetical protein